MRAPHNIVKCALLAAACGLMASLHFQWFPVGVGMLPIMGIGIAGLRIGGLACWPAIPLGIAMGLMLRDPLPTFWQVMGTVTPVTASSIIGALAIRRLRLNEGSQMPAADVARLAMVCVFAILFNHGLRLSIIAITEPARLTFATLPGELLRSALGILIWLPFAFSWLMRPITWPRWETALHFAAMITAVVVSAALIHLNPHRDPIAWGVMPALVWAALAFQARGATVALVILAFFTLYGGGRGLGPFQDGQLLQPWMSQIYLLVMAGTTLILARLADHSKTQSELRETARQLRAREGQLRQFIVDAPVAIAMFDTDLRYLAWSRRYLADYRLPPDKSLTGLSYYDVFPDLRDNCRAAHRRALAGEVVNKEEEFLHRDSGDVDVMRWKFKPWHDGEGAIGGIILFSEVVTEAVTARRAAEEAQARYRAVFDQTHVGIARSSLDRRFFEANEPACVIVGHTREELLKLGPQDITHPDDWAATAAAAAEMLSGTRSALDREERVVTRDGVVRWIRLNLSLVRDAEGNPLEFVSIVQDITEWVETQERLNLARDKLMRISRLSAMGAMASTLAHELNQPLAAASNYLTVAHQKLARVNLPDAPAFSDVLMRGGEQIARAGDIIRKMRQFTVTGELSLKPEDLDAMIAASCALVRERDSVADVQILHHLNPDLPPVLADRVQLEQVITNLVLNGAESCSGRAEREVHISAARDGAMITITVRDTGTGLSPEVMENLFEPFRTTKEKGTGLGLPICRTIIEAHGGSLWAEPTMAPGAVLKFTLMPGDGRGT